MSERKTIPIEPTLPAASSCDDAEPFALMVLDELMEPEFQHRDIIVCEPEGLAHDGSFVVAKVNEDFYFRQLQIIDGEWLLKALNPAYPDILKITPDAIKGVVVLKKKPGRRKAQKSYT